jgi:DNA-binding transcriptional ArsR family regulator
MPEKQTAASARSSTPRLASGGDPHTSQRLRLLAAGDASLRPVVDRLLLGPASAAEVAADLGRDAQAVRHLLRRLVKGGVVERGKKSNRRGVSEFLYACDPRRTALSSELLSGLPAEQVDRGVVRVLRELFREAMAASTSESYFAREKFIAARFPFPLDRPGWRRAALLHTRLLDSIAEARERANARLSCGAEPIETTAATLFFEVPRSHWPPPFAHGELPSGKVRRHSILNRVDAITATTDPLRMKIADALTMGPATAVDLAATIGAPLARVRYELRAFEKAAMVKVHRRRERRGAIENVFIADNPRMTASAADFGGRDRALRDYGTGFSRTVFREAVDGVRNGSFGDRADWRLNRTPMRLDADGFAEISASMDATLEELFDLKNECFARRANGAPTVRPAFFNLLLFERESPMFKRS